MSEDTERWFEVGLQDERAIIALRSLVRNAHGHLFEKEQREHQSFQPEDILDISDQLFEDDRYGMVALQVVYPMYERFPFQIAKDSREDRFCSESSHSETNLGIYTVRQTSVAAALEATMKEIDVSRFPFEAVPINFEDDETASPLDEVHHELLRDDPDIYGYIAAKDITKKQMFKFLVKRDLLDAEIAGDYGHVVDIFRFIAGVEPALYKNDIVKRYVQIDTLTDLMQEAGYSKKRAFNAVDKLKRGLEMVIPARAHASDPVAQSFDVRGVEYQKGKLVSVREIEADSIPRLSQLYANSNAKLLPWFAEFENNYDISAIATS